MKYSVAKHVTLGVLLLILNFDSLATVITVTNNNDTGPGSLRLAITAAAPDDTIKFHVDLTGIIAISSTYTIAKNLTIIGHSPKLTKIDGGGTIQIFNIIPGGFSLILQKITLQRAASNIAK